jgi:carboxypeptidase Taq
LNGHFDPKAQWQLARESASMLGFDWERGRLDKSSHPFTTTFNLTDVRITTNVCEKNILSSLYSTMHECGHALYEQGIVQELDRTPLGTGASLAIHESQSRLWENIVGRSLDFLTAFYPQIQAKFPKQFQHVALNDFYRAVNQVRPSLIRTESDEMTYNLHIMLRLELEIEVLEKRTAVADLPEAWRNKMNDYLGVIPKNDAEGVLQDVHWAGGAIGYFPTYALGNVISAQIWETALNELPNLQKQIRSGNLAELRNWLREKLHRHGGKFYPSELVKNITGNAIDPKPYLNYLKQKYSMARS